MDWSLLLYLIPTIICFLNSIFFVEIGLVRLERILMGSEQEIAVMVMKIRLVVWLGVAVQHVANLIFRIYDLFGTEQGVVRHVLVRGLRYGWQAVFAILFHMTLKIHTRIEIMSE